VDAAARQRQRDPDVVSACWGAGGSTWAGAADRMFTVFVLQCVRAATLRTIPMLHGATMTSLMASSRSTGAAGS